MRYGRTTVVPLLLAAASLAAQTPAASRRAPRERISIDEGWRFTKNDPPGNAISLLYDVPPEVRDQRDDRPADAQPTAAERLGAAPPSAIQSWILPTGNAVTQDPARRIT